MRTENQPSKTITRLADCVHAKILAEERLILRARGEVKLTFTRTHGQPNEYDIRMSANF